MAEELMTEELTLYDAEAEADKKSGTEPLSGSNGTTTAPQEPEYVETDDEAALRSLIFQTSDVVERLIDVPEWKVIGKDGKLKIVQVLVRALPAKERAQFLQSQHSKLDFAKAYPDLVILTARHPITKKLLFKPADREELGKKSGAAVERIALVASDISGLSPQALEAIRKN